MYSDIWGTKKKVGHVVLKELGQSTIFVLTEFIVSSSPSLFLVGYHVHPICILSQAALSSVSPCLLLKNNGPKKTFKVR